MDSAKRYSTPARVLCRVAAALAALSLLLLNGCATPGPLTPDAKYQTTLGRVAVVSVPADPEIKFEGFALSKGEGAAIGAAGFFGACLQLAVTTVCSTVACAPGALFGLGYCALAATVGGVGGAAFAPNAESVQSAKGRLSAAVITHTIQESLRNRVVAAMRANGARLVDVTPKGAQESVSARDYRALSGEGIDTVLETVLTHAGAQGEGINPPLLLSLQAHVRLVRTADNVELYSGDYVYLGKRLTLAEWVADDGKQLLQALETGYEALGSHIHDSVFLLYRFPEQKPTALANLFPATYGLAPILPATNHGPTGERLRESGFMDFDFMTIDTLQPTVEWQGFPREADLERAPQEMSRAKNVTYDLIVARAQNLAPMEIIYRRDGMTDRAHKLETPLMPNTRYFWTVRARFELDGRRRVTEWGSYRFEASDRHTSPSHFSYRFKTPRSSE